MADSAPTFMIENAQIIFRNFEGKAGQYNDKGDRNFAVVLTAEEAEKLLQDGWNVKSLPAREEGDDDTLYISVKVNYDQRPPRVVMINSSGRSTLTEEMVEVLDFAEFANVDLICRGYIWEVNGKTGVKAYLQSMYVTVEEDALARKYAALEDDQTHKQKERVER